jgi:hypothetical protein
LMLQARLKGGEREREIKQCVRRPKRVSGQYQSLILRRLWKQQYMPGQLGRVTFDRSFCGLPCVQEKEGNMSGH